MPQYSYICKKCGKFSKLVKYEQRLDVRCPNCDACVEIFFGKPLDCMVTETPDKYRNKRIKKDVQRIIKERNINHTKKHELGELIEKHGIENIKKTSFWEDKK